MATLFRFFGFIAPKDLKVFAIPIFFLGAYLMKVYPETQYNVVSRERGFLMHSYYQVNFYVL